MSLSYLTGDDYIGKSKKKSSSGGQRKTTKAARKAAKKTTPKAKKTKEQKKAGRKRVFKKVAKVAVAPARAALLTAAKLNLLKLSTKIARAWKAGGKNDITKWWTGVGGNMDALKKAVNQGAKDTISGDKMGAATVAATVAAATPLIVALVPILKKFKAAGSEQEAAEFNTGLDAAKRNLADNEDVPKSEVSMPANKEAGIVVDKSGEASQDEKAKDQPESKSGGTDSEDGEGDEKKKGMKTSSSEESSTSESATDKAKKELGSVYSPLGLFFMTSMYLMFFKPQGIFFELIGTYCFIGMILIPFADKFKFARVISYTPINVINSLIHKSKLQWQKNQQ